MPFIIYIHELICIKGEEDARVGKFCDECLRERWGEEKDIIMVLFPSFSRAYFYRNHCYTQNISSGMQNETYLKTWYKIRERRGFYMEQGKKCSWFFFCCVLLGGCFWATLTLYIFQSQKSKSR